MTKYAKPCDVGSVYLPYRRILLNTYGNKNTLWKSKREKQARKRIFRIY